MPLAFVHGVNTRNDDPDYYRSVAARKAMFERYVVPAVVKQGFPDFTVAEDVYWGDLGVNFGWSLRSVPATNILQSLGPAEDKQNLDLLDLALATTHPEGVQSLGANQPFVAAAKKDPGGLVRSVFAGEANSFAPRDTKGATKRIDETEAKKAANQGEHLGLMLIAVEMLARDAEQHPEIIEGTTDGMVLDKIADGVTARYRVLAAERMAQSSTDDVQHLGNLGNPFGWIKDHLSKVIESSKTTAKLAVAETQRAGTLMVLKQAREGLSRRGLRFLGDVFVYLHHGRAGAHPVSGRVRDTLLTLKGRKNSNGESEPFILVTHSFGSEIVYDLLISGALTDLPIDLWVTAGAQTSLFAEMLLFDGLPTLPANTADFVLGRPAGVKKWINFYDAADVLSYLHEPVFGKTAVADIQARAQANMTNAHGHYFIDPGFYERIATEV
jgi:hypothetical protein